MGIKLLGSAFALGIVVLAGCSNADEAGMPGMDSTPAGSSATSTGPTAASSSPAATHNDADTQFASMMIPHHQQAISMSDMLLAKKGIDADVTALAQQITSAQAPEVAQMSGWLADWGENPSPSSMGGMAGMDHGDGLMSQADMDALDQATGQEAQQLFLTGMIRHHQGAVTMAQTELSEGQYAGAKALARTIVSTQKAEISQMNQLVGR